MTRQQVPNRDLGLDAARSNLFVNPGFEIWQRGVGPVTTNTFFADRWMLQFAGPDTMSVSRDSANADVNSQYCAALTVTRPGSATVPAFSYTQQDVYLHLRGRTISISARVRGSVVNSVRWRMNDGVSGVQYGPYHAGSGTYEAVTATYAVGAAATAMNFALEFDKAGTYYVDNATEVVGSVPADYAPLHPADDLARCQRYYEVLGGVPAGYPSCYGIGATVSTVALSWKVTKAVAPTLTKVGTWGAVNCSQPAFDRGTTQGCRMYSTGSAAGTWETYPADATTYLTVEANP